MLLSVPAGGTNPHQASRCNPQITVDGERLEVDLLWPSQRLVVELDGHAFHAGRASFERDRRRDRRLTLAGYRVLRITWRQIEQEGETVVTAIRRLLETGR